MSETQQGPSQQPATTAVLSTVLHTSSASFADLKAACPGCDNDFLCGQLAAAATVDQARSAWMAEQNRRLEAARQEAADAKAAAEAAARKPGVAPVPTGKGATDEGSDPIAAWNEAVEKEMDRGKSKTQAVATVVSKRPGLHAEYLVEVNRRAGRPCSL